MWRNEQQHSEWCKCDSKMMNAWIIFWMRWNGLLCVDFNFLPNSDTKLNEFNCLFCFKQHFILGYDRVSRVDCRTTFAEWCTKRQPNGLVGPTAIPLANTGWAKESVEDAFTLSCVFVNICSPRIISFSRFYKCEACKHGFWYHWRLMTRSQQRGM